MLLSVMQVVPTCAGAVSCPYYLDPEGEVEAWWSSRFLMNVTRLGVHPGHTGSILTRMGKSY